MNGAARQPSYSLPTVGRAHASGACFHNPRLSESDLLGESMPSRRASIAAIAIVVYLFSVILANWLTTRYGFVPVGFGHLATAGTFAAGGALVVRDVVQDAVGRVGVLALIAITGLVSYLVADPSIATASMVAFLASEMLDMTAYTPLRSRAKFGDWRWRAAVLAGGAVGAVADTLIFLTI